MANIDYDVLGHRTNNYISGADDEGAFSRTVSLLRELGPDELRVMHELAKRLWAGQTTYGRLNISRDTRDWTREASEEALDLSVYLAIRILKGK